MEKHYRLKTVQKSHTCDFLNVSANVFLGERRIGSLHTCPDTEAMEFEFPLLTDRIVFEAFIAEWWGRADRSAFYDLPTLAMLAQNPSLQIALATKMQCWVKSIVSPTTPAPVARSRPARAAA